MTLVADGLVVGVDTHKDVHVAVVLDRLGRRLAVRGFPATDAGNTQLVRWLAGLGPVTDAGVEGTGSYGYRLSRLLADAGLQVWEINCPDRSRRRRKGKSDPVDAENAARTVLAGEATAVPKDRRGFVGELRLLLLTRRSAVKARTQASNQIKAFLLDGDDALRARLHGLRKRRFGRCEPSPDHRTKSSAMRYSLPICLPLARRTTSPSGRSRPAPGVPSPTLSSGTTACSAGAGAPISTRCHATRTAPTRAIVI